MYIYEQIFELRYQEFREECCKLKKLIKSL